MDKEKALKFATLIVASVSALVFLKIIYSGVLGYNIFRVELSSLDGEKPVPSIENALFVMHTKELNLNLTKTPELIDKAVPFIKNNDQTKIVEYLNQQDAVKKYKLVNLNPNGSSFYTIAKRDNAGTFGTMIIPFTAEASTYAYLGGLGFYNDTNRVYESAARLQNYQISEDQSVQESLKYNYSIFEVTFDPIF
jgi:hypothetical protein